MAESCSTIVLSLGFPKTVEDLGISVLGSSHPSRCTIRTGNVCFSGTKDLELDLNQTKTVTCDDHLDFWWEVSYIEYRSEYAVEIKVCKMTSEEEPEPTPPPLEGEVDYERIERETAAIVDAAETSIKGDISGVGAGVSGVKVDIGDGITGLKTHVSTQASTLSGVIGDLETNLTGQISGVLETLAGGINGISDKLDTMQFPTVDSIKAAFLDTCADLASALWDAILDRIEERYPKDEEESD